MAGFANVRAIVDAEGSGFGKLASWRKQPTQATGAGFWFDLSMSPGNPVPNYYIGTPNMGVWGPGYGNGLGVMTGPLMPGTTINQGLSP